MSGRIIGELKDAAVDSVKKALMEKAAESYAKLVVDPPLPKKKSVTPIATSETHSALNTLPWFVEGTEYGPRQTSFQLLINGEEAFAAVHDAIDRARHSVNILCWGFQPSMCLKRGHGGAESIGKLLERKGGPGKSGVKINVLCYAMKPEELPVPTLGLENFPVNITQGAGETTTPGQHLLSLDRPGTMSSKSYHESREWFARYDETQRPAGIAGDMLKETAETGVKCLVLAYVAPETFGLSAVAAFGEAKGLLVHLAMKSADLANWLSKDFDPKPKTDNIRFVTRGFSALDRVKILGRDHDGEGRNNEAGTMTSVMLAAGASHHQKVVLIDYEDPKNAVGFVMGHNMLDEYWDKSDHSYKRLPPEQANLGRNGSRPRQDFSCRVTGPVVGDLYKNFAVAWQRDTDETLPEPSIPFDKYVPRPDSLNPMVMAQVTRTQAQEGEDKDGKKGTQNIKKAYLQAVNNATQYIYIENQYFRWPLLADRIVELAQNYAQEDRDPAKYGPLYLFAITNADQDGMGKGIEKTGRMLAKLGRDDVLPGVARQQRAEDAQAERLQARQARRLAGERQYRYQESMAYAKTAKQRAVLQQAIDQAKQDAANAKAREQELDKKMKESEADRKNENRPIRLEQRPGLKVHVCTLVSPDTPGRTGRTATNVGKPTDEGSRAITRQERIEQLRNELYTARSDNYPLIREIQNLDLTIPNHPENTTTGRNLRKSRDDLQARLDQKLKYITDELKRLEDGSDPIDWVDVYVHAKLMIIDDTFMTVGSANINVRSMDTDSELNISHADHRVSLPARQKLWGLHTNGQSGMEPFNKTGMKDAYDKWDQVMKNNKSARKKMEPPIASLVEFFSATKKRTDLD